jgi:hypothetical protein
VTGAESSTPDRRLAATLWSCLWLSLALAAVFPIFAAFGFAQSGTMGVAAAAVSTLVCWVGATSALLLMGLFRTPEQALVGLLLGMFFRMGLPLGAALLLSLQGGALVEAGVMYMLIVNYLLALVLETLFSLRLVRPAVKVSKTA